jgi:hypothetical protein
MRPGMGFLEVDWVYSGIYLGGPDVSVAKQLLDIADICSLLEKMGCAASAEAVR